MEGINIILKEERFNPIIQVENNGENKIEWKEWSVTKPSTVEWNERKLNIKNFIAEVGKSHFRFK